MTTPVGERDALLQVTVPRYSVASSAVLLNQSAIGFHINNAGANDPASITFTATLIGLSGSATFASTGGTLTISGNVATLTYANMPGATASVTASVTVNGVTTTSNTCFVTKVLDGAAGAPGARGPGQYYASGTTWSDTTANAVVVAPKQVNDVVTITGTGFAQTRRWDGTNWVQLTGTVDPSLLLAASLDATKFASSIEPITMVTSVPVAKSTSAIFNTTDSKLYRWNGTAYIGTAGPSDLAADSVIAGKIAASAVNAREIAAGAIRTDKLLVISGGMAINPDPFFKDITAFNTDANTAFVTLTDGISGSTAIRSSTAPFASSGTTKAFPMTAGRVYRASSRVRAVTNPTNAYFRCFRLNSAAGSIQYQLTSPTYGLLEGAAVSVGAWQTWEAVFTAEPGTVNGYLEWDMHWNNVNDGRYMEMQDMRLEEVLPGTLIQDGIITTPKLAALAVTADKMSVASLSVITPNVGLLRPRTSGGRIEIADELIKVIEVTNATRIKVGYLL